MGPLSIQWRKDEVAIPGATNTKLSFQHVQTADAGIYSALIIGPTNSFSTSNATLTVNPSQRPGNDAFMDRFPIVGLSNTVSGSSVFASKEVGAPDHGGSPGGSSV